MNSRPEILTSFSQILKPVLSFIHPRAVDGTGLNEKIDVGNNSCGRVIESSLYCILKLSNVTGIIVLDKLLHGHWAEILLRLVQGIQTFQERRRQRRDITLTITKWGKHDV